jgi:hypothetical protein
MPITCSTNFDTSNTYLHGIHTELEKFDSTDFTNLTTALNGLNGTGISGDIFNLLNIFNANVDKNYESFKKKFILNSSIIYNTYLLPSPSNIDITNGQSASYININQVITSILSNLNVFLTYVNDHSTGINAIINVYISNFPILKYNNKIQLDSTNQKTWLNTFYCNLSADINTLQTIQTNIIVPLQKSQSTCNFLQYTGVFSDSELFGTYINIESFYADKKKTIQLNPFTMINSFFIGYKLHLNYKYWTKNGNSIVTYSRSYNDPFIVLYQLSDYINNVSSSFANGSTIIDLTSIITEDIQTMLSTQKQKFDCDILDTLFTNFTNYFKINNDDWNQTGARNNPTDPFDLDTHYNYKLHNIPCLNEWIICLTTFQTLYTKLLNVFTKNRDNLQEWLNDYSIKYNIEYKHTDKKIATKIYINTCICYLTQDLNNVGRYLTLFQSIKEDIKTNKMFAHSSFESSNLIISNPSQINISNFVDVLQKIYSDCKTLYDALKSVFNNLPLLFTINNLTPTNIKNIPSEIPSININGSVTYKISDLPVDIVNELFLFSTVVFFQLNHFLDWYNTSSVANVASYHLIKNFGNNKNLGNNKYFKYNNDDVTNNLVSIQYEYPRAGILTIPTTNSAMIIFMSNLQTDLNYLKSYLKLFNKYSSTNSNILDVNSFDLVRSQNNLLQNNIKNLNEMYSTDDTQGKNVAGKTSTLQSVNYYLFLIYAVFFLILAFFMYQTQQISIYLKIVLLLCFAAYPFAIYYLENSIYGGVMKLYNI